MPTIHLEEFLQPGHLQQGAEGTTESLSEADCIAVIKHHGGFGQRGKTPEHRVLPSQWRHLPFSKPVTTPWNVPVAPDQLALLLIGFVPLLHQDQSLIARLRAGDTLKTHIVMSSASEEGMTATEDKWFVYSEGPDADQVVRLHMHASWTGFKHIEMCIDAGFDGYGRDGEGARITSLMWESDPERGWKNADAAAYKAVARKVCSWVLGVELGVSSDSEERETGRWMEPTVARMISALRSQPTEMRQVYRYV